MTFLPVLQLSFGEGLIYGVPLPISVNLVIPVVTCILSLAFLAWVRGYWSLLGRVYYSLIALASIVIILFADYWNMLGWKF